MRNRHEVRALRWALIIPALAIVALPVTSHAAQLIIKPAKLIPYSSQQECQRSPLGVNGGADVTASYWYMVKLPPGTVITSFEYQHAANPAGATTIGLLRRKSTSGVPVSEGVWAAQSTTATATSWEFISIPGSLVSGASATIEAGWDYFVAVICANADTRVGAIKITY